MNCPACTAALEFAPNGAHARCSRCERIFALPSLTEVMVPVGVDPQDHGETLGFPPPAGPALPPDPITAAKNAFAARAAEKASAGVRLKVGGVAIDVGSGGVGVNTAKLEKDLTKKAGDAVSGWIWGCVGSVVIGGLVLLGFVVIGGIVTWQILAPGGGGGGASEAAAWDGKAPLTCGGNDNVTLEGVSAALPGQTAISAGGNCTLTLVDVDVSGGTALSAAGNATVTVSGGRLAGTDEAVSASANATVTGSGVKVEGDVKKKGGATVTGL